MRTFNVQVTQERAGGKIEGLVVTLDDITDLMAARAPLRLGRRRPPHRP